MSSHRTIILDTSVFIAGFNPSTTNDSLYSVPEVRQELTREALTKLRFEAAEKTGKMIVLKPQTRFIEMILDVSRGTGDVLFLSNADINVLALALQLKSEGEEPNIATDDYSIQNVAEKLNLNFVSIVTFGISYYFRWLLYCPACWKKYPTDYQNKQCEICGTQLKKKPLEKTAIKKGN